MMLTPAQMRRIEPYFPRWHGVPRVDGRLVLSGILFVIRNGLRWRDAPAGYGSAPPPRTSGPRCWRHAMTLALWQTVPAGPGP